MANSNSPTPSQKGFTIIETMFVLAIASLIMVIMFWILPSVQRSVRNKARKTDASFISNQRTEFGQRTLNTTVTNLPPQGYDCSPPLTKKYFCEYIRVGLAYYKLSNVQFQSNQAVKPAVVSIITDPEIIRSESYLKCKDGAYATTVGATPTDMVMLYAVETSSGVHPQCLDGSLRPRLPDNPDT